MRMSRLFNQTLRDAPAEAEVASHQLLLRAGYIRQLAAGVFSYLPLARRALDKIETIIRKEIEAIGGQELLMPVVHPADLWKESGRWQQIDAELGRFKDRSGRDMALAMTHEEVIADLVRKEVRSYRQLPLLLYHIQTKWRDDPRPRAGLIRTREFTMKDSYSLDADWEGLDRQYRAHYQAYFNIFRRCGLPVIAVKSDVGMMGGKLAHEFMYLSPIGEDTLLLCDACGYSANRQIALIKKPSPAAEASQAVEKVATPETKTIEALAQLLGVPKAKTAKAVFLVASLPAASVPDQGAARPDGAQEVKVSEEQFVFAIVRGDMEVNETKLANALKARSLRPATEEEIRAAGAVPGYASPVGLDRAASRLPVIVVVDDLIPQSPSLVAGANEAGYHLLNVNYGRDYKASLVADIVAAQEGDACPDCGSGLRAVRGVEVGNIFKLGTRYSDAFDCIYLDREGKPKPVIMGSYGIGSPRLLACVAEEYHDEQGLAWPVTVAPFTVHLVVLIGRRERRSRASQGSGDQEHRGGAEEQRSRGAAIKSIAGEQGNSGTVEDTRVVADRLYEELWEAGIEVLYDDRDESPGVKFTDADLIGLPLRLTVSDRALKQGGVELKRRNRQDRQVIPAGQIVSTLRAEIAALEAGIAQTVTEVPYPED